MHVRAASLMLTILATVLYLFDLSTAFAQTPGERVEVGAQVSALRLSDFKETNAGFGGRAAFDLSEWAAVEGEFNLFPHDDITVRGSVNGSLRIAHRRRRAEVWVGAKLGMRADRFGVFAKVRPGFARLTHRDVRCVGAACALISLLLVQPVYRTEFAMDVGGVLEFYPSPRTVVRLDLGDTMIRHRSQAPPCWDCSSHNVASRLGIGFRF